MEAISPREEPEHEPDEDAPQGEFVSLQETLIVAPTWGKLRRAALEDGQVVEAGSAVAHVEVDGPGPCAVRSSVHGVFLGWMAWEGENVGPGTPVARVSLNGDA